MNEKPTHWVAIQLLIERNRKLPKDRSEAIQTLLKANIRHLRIGRTTRSMPSFTGENEPRISAAKFTFPLK